VHTGLTAGLPEERLAPRAARKRARARAAAIAGCALLVLAGNASAAAPPADPVGARLGLQPGGPRMQPVNTPAAVARVAVVPGSPASEAWAIGFTHAPGKGYGRATAVGQTVFLRYTNATGWILHGPPVNASGNPVNEPLSSLALVSTGEGWAVGSQGALYHRLPGGRWVLQPQRLTTNALFRVALAERPDGIYGYAVGANLTILRLAPQGWTRDQATSQVPTPGNNLPDLVSVAMSSPSDAWAVSGINSNQLWILHRTEGGWERVLTGRTIFDSPPAPVSGQGGTTVNQFARGAGVATDGARVWISGSMQPIDATRPTGDASTADRSRPFVVRLSDGGSRITSYCPPLYQLSSSGVESTIDVCDRRFPFATGSLFGLAATGGEVFAGGFGLFHYAGGRWTREPNTAGYVASLAFSSREEGWAASPGNVFSGSGTASSTSITLGHWTTRPQTPAIRRWPHADTRMLEAVAAAPGGPGATAVGRDGAIVSLTADAGWEVQDSPTEASLHAIAWPEADRAFAVGEDGAIAVWDGRRWRLHADSGLVDEPLYGVAVAGDRGVAVGKGGTILRYDDGRWRRDPASGALATGRLNAVAKAGGAFVIAGDKGTILVDEGAGWRAITFLRDKLAFGQDSAQPNLLTVAGLPDGTALIGGEVGTFVERSPAGAFRLARLPSLEGTVYALAARRDARGALRVVASVGTASSRYAGSSFLAQGHGWLFANDGRHWRDVSLGRAAASTPDLDAPALRDASYGLALDAGGDRGWAVGGFPREVFDEDGHLRSTETSSIWRLDLGGPPAGAPTQTAGVPPASPGLTFAFLADTACATGLCSAVLGSGSRGDVIATEALRAIDALGRRGIVRFALHGGDLRRNGFPDELLPVRTLLDDVSVPVFGVIGDKDLFAGLGPSVGEQEGGLLPSNGYYVRTLADRPGPWGEGPLPDGFDEVRVPGQQAARAGARTHYAFDVRSPAGRVRIVVLDTSVTPLASNVEGQNPQEEQTAWLQAVLADARTAGIPSVVAMHQPLVLPVSTAADASVLTGILTGSGASLALAGHRRSNEVVFTPDEQSPDRLPVGIFGGGGTPLQRESDPNRGAYHAWQLVTIDPDPVARTLTGRAPATILSIPVLESVALDARDGRAVVAGGTLRFAGLGRIPDVGGPHALGRAPDQEQGRATYLAFPQGDRCGLLQDPVRDGCLGRDVLPPWYRFTTEDRGIAAFVRPDPANPRAPYRDAEGNLELDEHGGLLCAFRPGTTSVVLEAGVVGARVPIVVGGGSGPCIPGTFALPLEQPPPGEPALDEPASLDDEPFLTTRSRIPDPAAVAGIALPIINTAPAPPAGGGGQRQQKHEAVSERADATALPVRNRSASPAPIAAVLILGAFALALGATGTRRPIARPSAAGVPTGQAPRRQR